MKPKTQAPSRPQPFTPDWEPTPEELRAMRIADPYIGPTIIDARDSVSRPAGRPPLQRTEAQTALLKTYRAAQQAFDQARMAHRQAKLACIDAGIPTYKL